MDNNIESTYRVGTVVGKNEAAQWTIIDEIGKGSYGTVYLLENNNTEELSALKIVSVPKGERLESYLREIETMNSLQNCPNIVKIQEYWTTLDETNETATVFIRMEYLYSFDDYLSEHPVDDHMVAKIGLDLLNGLESCEKIGVLHRDVKPSNILVSEEGVFKLGDFGTARVCSDTALTIRGTFEYMAPEVYFGKNYNHQADIYSLGLVLYELRNKGRGPFVNLEKSIIYHKDKEKALEERMKKKAVPAPVEGTMEFSHILAKALEYQPALRYHSAAEMKEDLLEYQKGRYDYEKKERARKRRKALWKFMTRKREIVIACSIVGVVFLSLFVYRQDVKKHVDPSNKKIRYEIENDILKVSGEGKMSDHYREFPWNEERAKISGVKIGEGITYVGEKAFSNCENLQTVALPSSLEDIGDEAFEGCKKLENITWPEGLDPLGVDIFKGCNNIKNIQTNLTENTFDILTAVLDSENDLWLKNRGNIVTDHTGKKVLYSNTKTEEIALPEGVTTVCSGAFYNGDGRLDHLKKVVFPSTIETIEDGAFEDCANLEEMEGLSYLSNVGSHAFDGTKWLQNQREEEEFIIVNHILLSYEGNEESIELPDTITVINEGVFQDMRQIKKLKILESVQYISPGAFAGCVNLEEVDMKNNMREEDLEEVFKDTKWFKNLSRK